MFDSASDDRLSELQALFSLELTGREKAGVGLYLRLLRRWASRINLAGPALLADPYPHILEAFWVQRSGLLVGSRIVDVGSGAGIPGLILALADRDLNVTLIERNQKKAAFLSEAARQVGLKTLVFGDTLEAFWGWEEADLATLRALKPAQSLLSALRKAKLPLLWLRAGEEDVELHGFLRECQLRIPGSRRRWATLLAPSAGFVSRET